VSLRGRGVTSTKFFKAFVSYGREVQRHLAVIFGTICSAI
jgi:hypothetical protein